MSKDKLRLVPPLPQPEVKFPINIPDTPPPPREPIYRLLSEKGWESFKMELKTVMDWNKAHPRLKLVKKESSPKGEIL